MKRIGIVGGGISGLVAAINLKTNDNEITILEKNNELGKKILLTGNGRCNFYNEDMDISHFHSSENIEGLINNDINNVLVFINKLGIMYKTKNGYYYPFSNKASTIRDTLLYEINKKKISVKTNYIVNSITKDNNEFIVNNELRFDYLVISVGGNSYPKTGSSGDINNILKSFDIKVNKLLPSLTNLHGNEDYFNKWQGIREDVKVSLYVDDNLVKEETGEIQLTKYGISGICVFNVSRYASIALNENKKVFVSIDFLPGEDALKCLDAKPKDLEILELLKRIFNEKLAEIIVDRSNIKRNVIYKNLSDIERERLSNNIKDFRVNITSTGSFDESQVTIGGVSLGEINKDTMEANKVKNLYIIGEALDIDGDCGGYNIAFAIYSALKVGIK